MQADLVPTIRLPPRFAGPAMPRLAMQVADAFKISKPNAIRFDFSGLQFIEPPGVVFLSNLIRWLDAAKETPCLHEGVDPTIAPHKYLDDSQFFSEHWRQPVVLGARPRRTTQPLQQISQSSIHGWLQLTLIPWLAQHLGRPQASLFGLKTCISELFNNIQDHTRYDIGVIFVQFFPNKNKICLAISDFGLGIPNTVRRIHSSITDSDAILKAVEEGFTSKSRPTNKGVGLDYLMRTAVLENGGTVTIYSCTGMVAFERDGGAVRGTPRPSAGFCPGTTFEINLRTDAIESIPDETEELSWD